jgi:hypothetical protein
MGIGERVWGATHPQFGLLLHTRGELAAAMGDLELAADPRFEALVSGTPRAGRTRR